MQGAVNDCDAALALDSRRVLALEARAGAKRMLSDCQVSRLAMDRVP